MNALVRKEVRLLLPALVAALVLAILPVWMFWPGAEQMRLVPGPTVFVPFALGVLLIGLASFGQELNLNTFSILLAQPLPRRRIWMAKTLLTAVALSLALTALCVSIHFRVEAVVETMTETVWRNALDDRIGGKLIASIIAEARQESLHDSLMFGALSALAAFSGGLWTMLLFRQTSAAFWFTLLVPAGLGMLAGSLFADVGLIATLGLYSAAGFLWAKKQFLRVQDTQWTGGIISFPAWSGSKASLSTSARERRPLRALVRKELQLHHVNLLIAVLLLVSHLLDIVVRRLGADYFSVHQLAAMAWESWPFLWLAMPLLVGGVAIAEERKLGTIEGFLCLPTTRRKEFAVKLLVAVLLGVVLGCAMPQLIEGLGSLIGLKHKASSLAPESGSDFFQWVFVSAAMTVIAFYASTLTRNLLQALGLALVLSVLAFFLVALLAWIDQHGPHWVPLWRGPLVSFILWPVMVVTVFSLAFSNFKLAQVSGKVWLRNFLIWCASLIGAALVTTVIYHRTWELWLPEEPQHGWSPRLFESVNGVRGTNSFVKPKMQASLARVAIILHDGRLWLGQRRVQEVKTQLDGQAAVVPRASGSWRGGFVAGRDWRDVAVTTQHTYAIQADGSLWDLSEVQPEESNAETRLRRFGDGEGWQRIAASREHFVAVKSDGTLWEWGDKLIPQGSSIGVQKLSAPVQLGTDTDWIAVSDSQSTSQALKRDGGIWRWGPIARTQTNRTWITEVVVQPERWLRMPGKPAISMKSSLHGGTILVMDADGTQWIGGDIAYMLAGSQAVQRAPHEMVPWRVGPDWAAIEFLWSEQAVGIKGDGTLWKWDQNNILNWRVDNAVSPAMMSRFSGWIIACPYGEAFLALSDDGSLCLWGDPDEGQSFGLYGPDSNRLLMPTRIKAKKVADLLR